MPKYEVIRNEYERANGQELTISTFEANDDVEALLKVAEHCGIGYTDDNYNEWYEEGFEMPALEEVVEWIDSVNGDGSDYIHAVKRVDTKETIYSSAIFREDEVNW